MEQLKYQLLELQPKVLLAYLTVSILHFCNLDNYVKRKTYQYQICPYGKKLFHLPSVQ